MENEEVQKKLEENIIPQEKPESGKKFKLDRKLIVAGAIIIVLAILGLVLFSSKQTLNKPTDTTNETTNTLSGSILLEPSSVTGKPGQKITAGVMVNTGGKQIKGVVIGIKYNPIIVENITLTPFKDQNSALSYSLTSSSQAFIDSKNGGAMLTLTLPKDIISLSGVGKIAELSFTIKPLKAALTSTSISVSPLTEFLLPNSSNGSNLTKNELKVTLPAGIPLLSPSPILK